MKKQKKSAKDIQKLTENLVGKLQKQQGGDDQGYTLTPKGALWLAIMDFFKVDDIKVLDEFQKRLVHDLSLISSGGESDQMFGDGVNDLMMVLKNTLFMAEDMYKKLQENGIDFDCGQYGMKFRDENDDGDDRNDDFKDE